MKDFYVIITNKGLETLARAKAEGKNISLTHLAVGDSLGVYKEPQSEQITLYNEVYRTAINKIELDENYKNQIVIEAVILQDIGGFFIREVGIFDENGDLFAIGKYPATYKPTNESGANKDLYIRLTLAFSNAPNIEIYENKHNALVSLDYLDNYAKKDLSNVPADKKSHQQWGDLQGGNPVERYHVNAGQFRLIESFMTQANIDSLAKKDLSNVPAEKKSHQQWGDLQGGNSTERYHLNALEYQKAQSLVNQISAQNAYEHLYINADGTGFSTILPIEVCQQSLTVNDTELLIQPLTPIYQVYMTADREIFINPVNVQNFNAVITIEITVFMTEIYKFKLQNEVVWLDGEAPDLNETGSHILALRSYNLGVSWVGSYQGKF